MCEWADTLCCHLNLTKTDFPTSEVQRVSKAVSVSSEVVVCGHLRHCRVCILVVCELIGSSTIGIVSGVVGG